MAQGAKQFIKEHLIPRKLFKALQPYYHGFLALAGHWYFGRPSRKLVVIGVTGTNGKSTTVSLIASILEQAGYKVGYTSTVYFKIAGKEYLNNIKMTMPSGWILQRFMADMVRAGCQYAVFETSSEGLAQNRHLGIHFDVAVFTKLTPEHIESHGGFENYKKAKGRLFAAVNKHSITKAKLKINHRLQKTIVVNMDDEHGKYFLNFAAQKHLTYGVNNPKVDMAATNVESGLEGISFKVKSTPFAMRLKGKFNVYNVLAAMCVAQSQHVGLDTCKRALEKFEGVPGRMEVLQRQPFIFLVDYAPEPASMKAMFETLQQWPKKRLIHIFGSAGGGRDKARRKVMGEMSGKISDIVIATNEDAFDEDPMGIIDEIASGALAAGKRLDETLFKVLDRREAIALAIKLAQPGDLVLLTGKGAEQKMVFAHGRTIDWDDRTVAQEELGKAGYH